MWRRIVVSVVLGSGAAPVAAADLYRCIGPASVTYQQAPCGPGQVVSKTIPVVTEAPVEKPKAAKSQRRTGPMRSGPSSSSGVRGSGSDSIERRRATCATAKRVRDEKLERLGLRRTFDDLRKLDDRVQAACRGL